MRRRKKELLHSDRALISDVQPLEQGSGVVAFDIQCPEPLNECGCLTGLSEVHHRNVAAAGGVKIAEQAIELRGVSLMAEPLLRNDDIVILPCYLHRLTDEDAADHIEERKGEKTPVDDKESCMPRSQVVEKNTEAGAQFAKETSNIVIIDRKKVP
eukprot:CAMPEP_0180651096 /NCGR_PEP_ID=MMETSP1037_2-20121125/52651_1 /TAXON_ID=632150 /ORGANISM="Azadinium spinosum, Strain 3D9" /LENGTH=155 /DNA_ID=CAMNT_0022676619 /DNA_START=46 /DNA_END=517 /DNA_ORIENTATION=-